MQKDVPAPLDGKDNLVAGRWVESLAGGRFDCCEALAPREPLGSWPTSGPADAERALDALENPRRELHAELRDAAGRLAADEAAFQGAARRIGLTDGEMGEHRRIFEPEPGRDPEREPGFSLCFPDWSGLFAGAFEEVCGELARGRACVLVADPALPMVADGLARALLAAGVPETALAVLHGLTREGLAALIQDERVRAVVASGGLERIATLRRLGQNAALGRERLELLRCRAALVDPHDDLASRAAELVDEAFGRARWLFGQRHGQVGRIFCPERLFSAFTAALLAELDEHESVLTPLPLIDRRAATDVQRQCAVGLDDGATLVFGGERVGSEQDRCILPTVLTNVEPGMACARRQAPLPILCLLRTGPRGSKGRLSPDNGLPEGAGGP